MTALSFVWVHPYSQNSGCDIDFRLLNTRILRRNTSIPLMSDALSILGNSQCEVVSCVDIKDAYHSIPLTERSRVLQYIAIFW